MITQNDDLLAILSGTPDDVRSALKRAPDTSYDHPVRTYELTDWGWIRWALPARSKVPTIDEIGVIDPAAGNDPALWRRVRRHAVRDEEAQAMGWVGLGFLLEVGMLLTSLLHDWSPWLTAAASLGPVLGAALVPTVLLPVALPRTRVESTVSYRRALPLDQAAARGFSTSSRRGESPPTWWTKPATPPSSWRYSPEL